MIFECALVLLAAIPAMMSVQNFRRYRRAPTTNLQGAPRITVLIPARNEERTIHDALETVLRSRGVELEVLVLDDVSDDATSAIVTEFAARDPRVRLLRGEALPQGWAGKPHACWQLAQQASAAVLCFLDSDVRLAPDALARMCAELECSGAALISGVPRQITVTFAEQLLIPLIHFILLGYLPIDRMRSDADPAYSAGCGQLFICRRKEYFVSGGHSSIPGSWHDGLDLPRAFRRHGYRTDLFDPTDIAHVRMYSRASEVWEGLGKNAVEGMAAPSRIGIFTVLLMGGAVLPVPVFLGSMSHHTLRASLPFALAALLSYLPRLLAVSRFRQPWLSAALHPLAVLLLLVIQWQALGMHLLGRRKQWKGRAQAVAPHRLPEILTGLSKP